MPNLTNEIQNEDSPRRDGRAPALELGRRFSAFFWRFSTQAKTGRFLRFLKEIFRFYLPC